MAQTVWPPVSFTIMKSSSILLFIAALAAGSIVTAAEATRSAVTVNFSEPDKFTDVASHFNGGTDKNYLEQLTEHLQKVASRQLAPGQRLEVTFTDIDLAGDFIPSNPKLMDVRVIKDIYIPRQVLFFRLFDADGKVIKEGERKLTDLSFMNNIAGIDRDQPLFYDKTLLTDWVRKELRP
jgi:hypothetical protein